MNTSDRFTVIVEPDGSVAITWPLTDDEQADPDSRQSALLDRDTVASQILVSTLRLIKSGAR